MSLTVDQAAVAKGLLARGEKMHDVAAYFGLNAGRIGELASGYITRKGKSPKPHPFKDVPPAPASALPSRLELVPWGFIMTEAKHAISIAEIGLSSARIRLSEIEAKLSAAAVLEQSARKRGRRR